MHAIASICLCLLVLAGWVYWLAAWGCVRRHFGAPRRAAGEAREPMLSVLKPLKGRDPGLYENLLTFCRQDYPNYEILIGVADAEDVALEVGRRVQAEFPQRQIRLIVAPRLGANPKTAILHALAREARGELLITSDADIRVTPGYLREVVAPLANPEVGLVTCAYRSAPPADLVGALGALHIDLSFLPSAVVASGLPGVRYAFGATIAFRRADLERSGGFEPIADYLADDYALGSRLADLGLRVQLSQHIVHHCGADASFRELWAHEVRWARTIRAVEPLRYLGLVATYPVVWAAALVGINPTWPWAWGLLAGSLLLRWAVAWAIVSRISDRRLRSWLAFLPLRGFLDIAVWCAGLSGRRVTWRDRTYEITADGRLAAPEKRAGLARRLVSRLDEKLRRDQGIFEYSDSPECLFRIELRTALQETPLRDGTLLAAGERYLELHFWNEHFPPMPRRGADLRWAIATDARVRWSLQELARFLDSHAEYGDIRAVSGQSSLLARSEPQLQRLLARYGFELHGEVREATLGGRLHRLGENMLIWGLAWAFNAGSLRKNVLMRPRHQVWMSRQQLRRVAEMPARRRRGSRPGADVDGSTSPKTSPEERVESTRAAAEQEGPAS